MHQTQLHQMQLLKTDAEWIFFLLLLAHFGNVGSELLYV